MIPNLASWLQNKPARITPQSNDFVQMLAIVVLLFEKLKNNLSLVSTFPRKSNRTNGKKCLGDGLSNAL